MTQGPPLNERAVNLPSGNSPPKPNHADIPPSASLQRGIQPSASLDSLAEESTLPVNSNPNERQAQSPPEQSGTLHRADSVVELAPALKSPGQGQTHGPPQRPRREGDEEFRRAMSPPNGPPSPTTYTHQTTNRVVSPTGPASPVNATKTGFNPSILGTRSPSPRMRNNEGERPTPPPDAFYYGRSPTTANGFNGRPGSISGSSELIKEIKTKDAELDAGKKREAALRTIISKAINQGFVAEDDFDDDDDNDRDREGQDDEEEDLVNKLTDALVRLKHEKAEIQVRSHSPTR